jgi:signal transduction histidine kinase
MTTATTAISPFSPLAEATLPTDLDTQILNATGNGIVALAAIRNAVGATIDFTMVRVNEPFTRLTRTEGTELLGQRFTAIFPTAQHLLNLQVHVLNTGIATTKEWHYEATGHWYLVSVSKLDNNTIVAAYTDTTETRRQNDKEIQHYDNRLQVVFDTAQAGMYTLMPVRDEAGDIIDFRFGIVNQAVAGYLGLSAEDLAGSLGSTHFPAYKSNGLFDRYVETMRTGSPVTFDIHYADGYDNYFTVNVVKMGDELFGTFTDHSPYKRLQRELEGYISELKRSNSSLEQFAHAASHDLKEPLRKISVYSEKLEEKHAHEMSDEAYGYVERIKTASKRMHRLIHDLLVFAEVGANRPEFEEVALNALVQEVLADLEVAISERDAVISVGELGTIKGDSLHLQQVFQNLIGNAIKYSKPEVTPNIRITASVIDGKDARFNLSEYESQKQFCCIQVQDNGLGFTEEQAGQIFKIFQRLPQHRLEYSGTGVGLAIVQRVVENHKGYIKAEGMPGVGATFTILLPVG